MSDSSQPRSSSVGGTLTGGIQDVSAILPIIGTDQCERHTGSALSGGYLYAASGPLSIFGCLGIVKAGVAVLISSMTIANFWTSHRDTPPPRPTGASPDPMIFGARMLEDAGFKLQGDVAPLIGMDGTRFKAETKLIELLEEKHIDNPENVSVRWKSRDWNIMLALSTIVAAALSGVPYFALLFGHASWQPNTPLPWLFPFLRTAGSCFASICCQLIIQSRVISLMKHRVLFMDINQQLSDGFSKDNKDGMKNWLEDHHHLQWDHDLPAEQCILSLQTFLASNSNIFATQPEDDPKKTEAHVSIDIENVATSSPSPRMSILSSTSIEPPPPPPPVPPLPYDKNFKFDPNIIQRLRNQHFPSATSDRAVLLILWIILLFSLPATVAGYVGCFTLVGASSGSGPLVWLGLEAALCVLRILIWAWNPLFDENTEITVELKLVPHPPMVTTEEHNAFIHDSEHAHNQILTLVPKHQFLEGITPFTGPLDEFANFGNVALYFTLMADYSGVKDEFGRNCTSLLLTVFDFNTRIGVTLLLLRGLFYYFDAQIKYDTIYNGMVANLQLPMKTYHSWQKQDSNLFHSLEEYYKTVVRALNSRAKEKDNIAILDRRWNLFPKATHYKISTSSPSLPYLSDHDMLYLDRGYEHHLKTQLVGVWSRWITENMQLRASDARNECYEALADQTSEKAKSELTELDRMAEWEWVKRELLLLFSSIELEKILRSKMEKCITTICEERNDRRLEQRMWYEFDLGRRKRLVKERGEAKDRMEEGMKEAAQTAEKEGRSWGALRRVAPSWKRGIAFIDEQWSEGIDDGPRALEDIGYQIDSTLSGGGRIPSENPATSYHSPKTFKWIRRFQHWDSQRQYERQEMEATIHRIRTVGSQREQMDGVYQYPDPDSEAVYKFAWLRLSSAMGKACSAIVYDVEGCSAEIVCDLVKKKTTRSVIKVDPNVVYSIPPNDHLLFLSCNEEGEEPAFVRNNRDGWGDQQPWNSGTFYFTPHGLSSNMCYISSSGTIAHILIFLKTPSRIRLRLLHYATTDDILLSIQRNGKNLYTLSDGIPTIPEGMYNAGFKLQDIKLKKLEPGRHDLQVVITKDTNDFWYYLRDILIEFFTDGPVLVSDSGAHINTEQPTIDDAWEESSKNLNKSALSPSNLLDSQVSQILSKHREMGV